MNNHTTSSINQYEQREALFTQIVEELGTQHDIYRAIPGIIEKACGYFGFDCGFIYEADHTGKLIKKEYVSQNPDIVLPKEFSHATFLSPDETACVERSFVYLHRDFDSKLSPNLDTALLSFFDVNAMLMVPFRDQADRLLGITGMMTKHVPKVLSYEGLAIARSVFMVIANHVKMRAFHRQLENAKRSLSYTMDHTGVDIYVNDFYTHEILYVNKSMAAPYGGAENMMGRPCYASIYNGQAEPCEYCPQKKLLDDEGNPTKIYSWDYRRPFDGAWFRVFSAAFKWVDGRLAHVVSSVDITDRKNYETRQKKHERELQQALNAAKEATRMKSTFLANMSHEIRTPMNAIIGMAELVLRKDIDTDVREHTVSIKQAGNHLISIINDVLDFSKIESGKFELSSGKYLFSSLVNDVISIIRVRVMEKPIAFTANVDCNIPNELIGDEIRIRQILLNVLGNAVKYTDEGFIAFDVKSEIDEENKTVVIRIDVADSGFGIREEYLPTLFDAFTQVDMNTRRGTEGTGLGLAITKNLCLSMGGDITVTSTHGEGSVFHIEIPQEFEQAAQMAVIQNTEFLNILLYETRQIYVESILNSCANMNVPCKAVSSQSDFVSKLAEERFSHIFVPYYLYEGASIAINKSGTTSEVVLLTEYTDILEKQNAVAIPMPIFSLSIANVLNKVVGSTSYRAADATFIAPDARILITDDITTNLKVAEGLMAPYKMQIDACKSGMETIVMLKQHRYDILFLDHMMPEMDGIETAKIIRSMASDDGYYEELPIIALTANVVHGAKEMFFANGISDFLAKPIEMSKLNAILDRWIPSDKKQKPLPSDTYGNLSEPEFFIRGLDVNSGIAQTGGTVDGYLQVLKTYYSEGLRLTREIRRSLAEQDYRHFTICVHALKSTSASIGAPLLYAQAKALEHAGRIPDASFIRENIDRFIDDLSVLLENILPALEATNAPQTETNDSEMHLRTNLENIRDALEKFDISTADSLLSTLIQATGDPDIHASLEAISDDILMSDLESAIEKIRALIDA